MFKKKDYHIFKISFMLVRGFQNFEKNNPKANGLNFAERDVRFGSRVVQP